MSPQELEQQFKERWRLGPGTIKGLAVRAIVVLIVLTVPFVLWLIHG